MSEVQHERFVRIFLFAIVLGLGMIFAVLLLERRDPHDRELQIILNCNPECEFEDEVTGTP